MALFRDRTEAGRVLAERVLAEHLKSSAPDSNLLVLALPRGGVPVGFEVARALHADFDIFLVRKLGLPGEEELAVGAIASGGVRVLNDDLIRYLRVPFGVIEQLTEREQRELERREHLYRDDRPPVQVRDRTVVLVDDGLATGASMLAASRALRPLGARRVVIAVPVGAPQTCAELRKEVDDIICAATPHPFGAVGIWYEDFSQTTDEDVRQLLQAAAEERLATEATHSPLAGG